MKRYDSIIQKLVKHRDMKNKFGNTNSLMLYKALENNEMDIFDTTGIAQNFELKSRDLQNYIDTLHRNGFIRRIEKGKYVKHTFSNEYVIGCNLSSDAVVAYWSALNIHGLTEQFPNKVYIQTTKKKQNTEVFGVNYQFVKVRPYKMVGIVNTGVGSNQFRISDVEKTIVDCFDLVEYSGGFMELIRAFYRTKLNSRKLIEYCKAVNNKAILKRIGYLAELLNKKGFMQFIAYAKRNAGKNYDLFDIYGLNEGKYNSEWRLRLNMENADILDIVSSIY